ncbi:hypothetical protein [Pseudoalteromonas piratica]|uniref:Uncharacterized protein n=1 Tax=Pseudoalteromonas piratica TaxID=1348114 RepID=A0A0A7EEN1_9GAMM|nr:hypothetical protein [Pseudoalteromonas piratica]AIY64526.1 hypothetical protein OM33_04725 [Pseudoalteromonas piratica]
MNESSSGIYRFLLVIIVFSLLYWVLAGKMLTIYDDVEKVSVQRSKEDFVTSVNHIRQQWMRDKQPEVKIKLVGQTNLAHDSELSVLVNEKGFAVKVLATEHSQCDGLFKYLQAIALSEVNSVEIIDRGQVIGCKYTKNSKMLFKYLFLNGIVSSN